MRDSNRATKLWRRRALGVILAITVGMSGALAAPPALAAEVTPSPDPIVEPTDVARPTPTPTPTPTETSTPTPTPTETARPTPTPIPTPTPDGTPSPDETLGPEDPSDAPSEGDDVGTLALPELGVVPTASRLSGVDRYATSIAASKAAFPTHADVVLVAAGSAAVDAVVAAGMAAALDAPLLYVGTTSIPGAIAAELRRLAPAEIVVVGGTGVVSAAVAGELGSIAPVRRFAGSTRYETSRAALALSGGPVDTVYLADGRTLVDPPLASVAAAATGRRMLLVDGRSSVDQPSLDALKAVGATSVIIVGGLSTVTAAYESSLRGAGFHVSRRAGGDVYSQAILIAAERTAPAQRAIVVNAGATADVAVAAALAAVTRQPLFYAASLCMPDQVARHLRDAGLGITAVGGIAQLAAAVVENLDCSTVRARSVSGLNAAIRDTLASYPGTFSVTVRELGGLGVVTEVGGGIRREPASMMKIFAAWAALKRVEQGRATMSTRLSSGVPLGLCIQFMIHVSDNYCHTDIVHWIGITEINRMIRDAGFTNTVYGTVAPGVSVLYAGNRTSTNDLAWMMQRLANRSILSKQYADHLVNLMRSQIWRSRIASGIPPGVPQASKPGSIWLTSGLLQGDTAIVNGPRSPYILSIIGDDGPPQAALRAISRTVYTHFNGAFGAAASYPVQQMVTRTPSLLRSSPGGAIVTTLPAGVAVQVLDAQRTWYQVQYGSRKLWVYYSGLRNR